MKPYKKQKADQWLTGAERERNEKALLNEYEVFLQNDEKFAELNRGGGCMTVSLNCTL